MKRAPHLRFHDGLCLGLFVDDSDAGGPPTWGRYTVATLAGAGLLEISDLVALEQLAKRVDRIVLELAEGVR